MLSNVINIHNVPVCNTQNCFMFHYIILSGGKRCMWRYSVCRCPYVHFISSQYRINQSIFVFWFLKDWCILNSTRTSTIYSGPSSFYLWEHVVTFLERIWYNNPMQLLAFPNGKHEFMHNILVIFIKKLMCISMNVKASSAILYIQMCGRNLLN